ncbi:MAG: DUF4386 domain-containing protein [Methanomassiliicoccus sp.]|nr:MAG: DUF4386 domain-containing protein [Methanomassiliicoccus sp.]
MKKMPEKYYRKTAAIVGALFIIATATSLVGGILLGSALDGPDYIIELPDVENDIMMAAMFETILAISLVGIGALMFPILRKHAEGLGMAYAGIRLVEAIFIIVGTICLLGMLTLGQDYAAGHLDQASSGSIGALLISIRDGAFLFGTLIFLGLGGLTLNYVLYRSMLVPRWLSAWGIIGGVGILIYGTMGLFGTDTASFDATTLLAAPIAVQEMVFASWLIIKGFNTPEEHS